ncbi:MAG: hypothetical protein IJD22_05565, partial [Clostridia bacterium]|nr:hypothetical protein [Clostridia bacterium]
MVKKRKSPFLDKLAAIFSYLLGLIFPPKCVICDDVLLNGGEMCPECLARWEKARRQKCPVCKKTARACTCHTFHMLNTDDIGDRKMTSLAFYTKFGSEDPVDITVLR